MWCRAHLTAAQVPLQQSVKIIEREFSHFALASESLC
jgi:hypothetical protein